MPTYSDFTFETWNLGRKNRVSVLSDFILNSLTKALQDDSFAQWNQRQGATMVLENKTEKLKRARTSDSGRICTAKFGHEDTVFVIISQYGVVVGHRGPDLSPSDLKISLWEENLKSAGVAKGKGFVVVPASTEWERYRDTYSAKTKDPRNVSQVCGILQEFFELSDMNVVTRGSGQGNVLVEFEKGKKLPRVFVENGFFSGL